MKVCYDCVPEMGEHPEECDEKECIFCGGSAMFFHNRMSYSCSDCSDHWQPGEEDEMIGTLKQRKKKKITKVNGSSSSKT